MSTVSQLMHTITALGLISTEGKFQWSRDTLSVPERRVFDSRDTLGVPESRVSNARLPKSNVSVQKAQVETGYCKTRQSKFRFLGPHHANCWNSRKNDGQALNRTTGTEYVVHNLFYLEIKWTRSVANTFWKLSIHCNSYLRIMAGIETLHR